MPASRASRAAAVCTRKVAAGVGQEALKVDVLCFLG
jgi:hypothetical protein